MVVGRRSRAATGRIEGLIGFFVNTLVLRPTLRGDPPSASCCGAVREATASRYAHQDLPFEKLVEALRPARDPSARRSSQVMLFALQNHPARPRPEWLGPAFETLSSVRAVPPRAS